jgi:hypothetical protein
LKEKLMQDHIRPVPAGDPTSEQRLETAQQERRERAQRRPATSRALPTDRLKFEVQVDALKALAVSSDNGKHSVGADDLATRLNLSPASAGLNNMFFTEMGLATKEGRGRYKPTPVTCEFARKHSFDAKAAGPVLGPAFSKTWCFQEVQRQTAMGRVTKDQMVRVLADAAQASNDHRVQLVGVLDWLSYAGLIEVKNDVVTVSSESTVDLAPDPPAAGAAEGITADPPGERSTKKDQGAPSIGEPSLSLSFDLALTANDLQRLSTEQITALFQAVGAVVAIKVAVNR